MDYDKIVQLNSEDITWSFDQNPPHFNVKWISDYNRTLYIDPFPCQSHNIKLLTNSIENTESKFKIPAIVRYAIMPYELIGRTNAMTYNTRLWNDDLNIKAGSETLICLSGKRTIIHPVMTKYLVAHEYGHAVDYYITTQMNQAHKKQNNSYQYDDELFAKIYAELRGIPETKEYGGGKWNNNIGEIIADDFRIIIANVDIEFFPHNCTHPLLNPDVIKFWDEMKKKYTIK